MAKEEKEVQEKANLTINDGIRFGFGFMLVHLLGFAVIGLVAWFIMLFVK